MTVQYIDDGRTDGSVLGNNQGGATPKIGFFGKAPTVQPAGNAQTSLTRGANAGLIMGFSASVAPASVATLTTVSAAMTLVPGAGACVTIAAGDVLFLNKVTSQAGLGYGNLLVSAAGVAAVTFSNFVSGFLTPTSQVYSFIAVRGLTSTTAVLTPAAVAVSTTAEQIFTVTGARVGDVLQVSKPTLQAGLDIVNVRVAGNNSVGITFGNVTSGTVITPTAGQTYTFLGLGGLDAVNNDICYQVSSTPPAIAAVSTINSGMTITNLAVGDFVTGVSKPTQQNGLFIANAFVSAAGSGGLVFGNTSSANTLTPTSETLTVRTWRPNVAAPLVVYQQALTPVSIAANTTAEQGFTVTGLITTSMVWVNKPTAQAGIGIVGCRVSAFNTLAINFANFTSAAQTPTAAEVYTIGNFQMPVEAAGNSWFMSALLIEQQTAQLSNAMQSTLAGLGLMAGA